VQNSGGLVLDTMCVNSGYVNYVPKQNLNECFKMWTL